VEDHDKRKIFEASFKALSYSIAKDHPSLTHIHHLVKVLSNPMEPVNLDCVYKVARKNTTGELIISAEHGFIWR